MFTRLAPPDGVARLSTVRGICGPCAARDGPPQVIGRLQGGLARRFFQATQELYNFYKSFVLHFPQPTAAIGMPLAEPTSDV